MATFTYFVDLDRKTHEELTELLVGVSHADIDAYEMAAPPTNATGSHIIHHPAVAYLMSKGCAWDVAYRIATDKCPG